MIDIRSLSSELHQREDGIWYGLGDPEVSYPSTGNEMCFTVEDSSFWFRHRNNCIIAAVKAHPPENMGTIFDIGGGNGFVSSSLARAGFDVALVEPRLAGARNARNRGIRTVICASVDTAKFMQRSLPAIGLFDVIEHIRDDLSFMKSMNDLLKKDGLLYVTVPSHSFLWSDEDIAAGHFRRYTLRTLEALLTLSGFRIVFITYFFRFLPIPIFLLRSFPHRIGIPRKKPTAEDIARAHAVHCGPASRLMHALLRPEVVNIQNHRAMRFGSSCLVVASCA